jgi:hypothetical protein
MQSELRPQEALSMRMVYRAIWVVSAMAIAGMTALFAVQPMALPVPAPMKRYTSGDRSIRILHPGNWKARERSSHGVETEVAFAPTTNARMTIDVDLQGSLVTDILKSSDAQTTAIANMVPGGQAVANHQLAPLEFMHAGQASEMQKGAGDYPGFKDGATTKTRVAGREAIVTECSWNAPGLLGSRPMVGRRITLLSGDHHVSIVYGCLKEMQAFVLQVFDQMLSSLEIDGQGVGQ